MLHRLALRKIRAQLTVVRHYSKAVKLPDQVPDVPGRVLERDIKIFMVEAGRLANRIHTRPEQQLQCVGGAAHKEAKLLPTEMRCTNKGVDDEGNVNWDYLVPELDKRVRLTEIQVQFEGWDRPGDPYVRAGSAVVRYELEYVAGATLFSLTWVYGGLVVLFILAVWWGTRKSTTVVIRADEQAYSQPRPVVHVVHEAPAPIVRVVHEAPRPYVHIVHSPPAASDHSWWVPDPSPPRRSGSYDYPSAPSSSTRQATGIAKSSRSA